MHILLRRNFFVAEKMSQKIGFGVLWGSEREVRRLGVEGEKRAGWGHKYVKIF